MRTPASLHCSFCNKDQNEIRKLIAGPAVFICNECIDVCNDIMADDARFAQRAVEPPPSVQREQVSVSPTLSVTVRCALCKLPLFSSEALVIDARGVLCPGCVDAVQAALAERDERHPS